MLILLILKILYIARYHQCIFKNSYKIPKTIKGVNFIKDDLLNKKKIETLFNRIKPNIVLHLAANNPSYNEKNYKIFFYKNLILFIFLLS